MRVKYSSILREFNSFNPDDNKLQDFRTDEVEALRNRIRELEAQIEMLHKKRRAERKGMLMTSTRRFKVIEKQRKVVAATFLE